MWLAMLPMLMSTYDDFRFDVKSLSFILSTESPDILHEILVEESRFHQAICAMNHRSQIHLEKVQPALIAAGFKPEEPRSMQEYEDALGMQLTAQMTKGTEEVVYAFDRALETSQTLAFALTEKAKKWFPGKNPIRVQLPTAKKGGQEAG